MISPLACGRTCVCDSDTEAGAESRAQCPVKLEFSKTPAQRLEDYRQEILQAQARESVNAPYKLQQAGVPYDAIHALGKLQDTKAISAAKQFLNAPRAQIRTLVLLGANGVGKSTAAAYALADFIKNHAWNSAATGTETQKPFRWIHASEVTSQTAFGKVDEEWLSTIRACRALVIDDLGKNATVPGLGAVRDLITHRHEKLRPTIITANLSLDALKETFGGSLYDRLRVASIVTDMSQEKSKRSKQ